MKTPRERATSILHGLLGQGFTTEMFKLMVEDQSERGKNLRDWREAIEKGIEQDRTDVAKSLSPS